MDAATAYRAVKGHIPRVREIATYTEQNFLDYFAFVNSFCEEDKKKGRYSIKTTVPKIKAAEAVLQEPYHPWQEMLYRIDVFTDAPKFNAGSFYIRIAAYNRAVLGYLKQNPAAVTDEMRKVMEANPRLSWALKHYMDKKSETGAEYVLPATTDTTTDQPRPITQRSPDKMLMEGIMHTANTFELIAKSIKASDLKELDVRDRVAMLQKLSFIFNVGRNFKPNANTFQQINIYSAKKDDLEKAILDFGKSKGKGDE